MQLLLKKLTDTGGRCFSLGGVAHIAAVVCFAFQSVCLNIFLMEYISEAVLVTLAAEIPLFLHLLWYWRQESAARAAPVQWLVYSWVHGAKVVVLFCKVMPRLPSPTEEVNGVGSFSMSGAYFDNFYSSTTLANMLLLTPVFYSLLMFRTSKAMFGSLSNRISVDLIMHYDMLWHVVIDMVDIVDMFHYARLVEWVGDDIRIQFGWNLVVVQCLVPVLLFLGVILHGQSLPGVVVDEWQLLDPKERAREANRAGDPDSEPPTSQVLAPTQQSSRGTLSFQNFLKNISRSRKPKDYATSSAESGHSSHGSVDDSSEGVSSPESERGRKGDRPPPPPAARPATSLEDGLSAAAIAASAELKTADGKRSQTASEVSPMSYPVGVQRHDHRDETLQSCSTRNSEQSTESRRRSSSGQGVARGSHRRRANHSGGEKAADRDRQARVEKQRCRRAQDIINLVQRHTVIVARKRSAIVSIFIIDMPFFLVRALVWYLSVKAGQPHFPGLGAKNGVCFLLNILQFTLVRMASAEGYADIQRLLSEYRWRQRRESSANSAGNPANAATGAVAAPVAAPSSIAGMKFGRPEQPSPLTPALSPDGRTPPSGSTYTAQPGSSERGSPHTEASRRDQERRKGIAECEQEIRFETRRTTSICAHFWALLVAFFAGLLLAKASPNTAIQSIAQWVDTVSR